MQARTPLWLSHHFPNEYDRCAVVAGRHVCRRCATFYPICFGVMALALLGVSWPRWLDPWLLWLLPIPVVVEWWLEHLDKISYSAWRNTAFSALCAPAVGVGLARYLADRGDTLFWSVVITYGVVCLTPMLISRKRRRATTGAASSRTAAGSVR